MTIGALRFATVGGVYETTSLASLVFGMRVRASLYFFRGIWNVADS